MAALSNFVQRNEDGCRPARAVPLTVERRAHRQDSTAARGPVRYTTRSP